MRVGVFMLNVKLKSTIGNTVKIFLSSQNTEDVANVLEIPTRQLLYLIYTLTDEERYSTFFLPKKRGGQREISAPRKGISILQKKLLTIIDSIWHPKPWVQGFTNSRSILTNARHHKKKSYVLNIDLKDFYGSINFGRVRGLFMSYPFKLGHKAATIIAQLVTFNNLLPQGASTSPIISNMIAFKLDNMLVKIARRYHLTYTRYADDITFSTTKSNFPKEIAEIEGTNPSTGNIKLGHILEKAIKESGFSVNYKKVRLQIPFVRQEVTGLTVNEFPNVERRFIRNVRAMVYAWRKHGLIEAEREYINKYASRKLEIPSGKLKGSYYKNVLYGKLAYIKMIRGEDDQIFIKYCLQLAELDSDPPKQIQKAKEMHEQYDVFLCHASEDKEDIAKPIFEDLSNAGIIVFLDDKYIKWGDSFVEKINHALGKAKYVIAILSSNSVTKAWPVKEINASIAREIVGKQKFLPLMVGDGKEIQSFQDEMPLISDKKYLIWKNDTSEIVDKIKSLMSSK